MTLNSDMLPIAQKMVLVERKKHFNVVGPVYGFSALELLITALVAVLTALMALMVLMAVMMLDELMTLMVVMMLVALGTLKNCHDPYSYGPLHITHKLPIMCPGTQHMLWTTFFDFCDIRQPLVQLEVVYLSSSCN